ncbi:MAG: hypothetical protein GY717_11960 [Rhodobacteraceae bacterium]|nr:hypothetical protein [Paracoccaceae bacterium]
MKSILTAAAAALVLTTGSAMAWEGRTVACFEKEWVGATYTTREVLHMAAMEKFEHVNGRIELVRYPAVYRQYRTKVSDGRWIMKQVLCGCPKC